ncbi:MAG TPA: TetR/AcrR family transcriptional regulator [Treponemataceae bacterium]|nr:TetR/AcrR family transcriptional regulator [Treponemataceae bacterium]
MAIVVEHDKRKREILENALDIFVEEGYEDATFQKIADRCGITRTTLYIYFKNKREIFLWSIKQLTQTLEDELFAVIRNNSLSEPVKLITVLNTIIDKCVENRRLFSVVLLYLLQLQKQNLNPGQRVRRRIIRLRHLLSKIIIAGINKGTLERIDVKAANDMFYALIESAIFRLAILDKEDIDESKDSIRLAVEGITTK